MLPGVQLPVLAKGSHRFYMAPCRAIRCVFNCFLITLRIDFSWSLMMEAGEQLDGVFCLYCT